MECQGAVAVVTGGASGLGLATVEQLVANGARVVIIDLPSSDGAAVADRLGDAVAFSPADVTDPDAVEAALDVAEELGPLRIAVNCAGIGPPARVVGKDGTPVDLDWFTRVVNVNLVGTFNVIRLAAARMVAHDPVGEERGVIVNTASIAAFEGQIGQLAYTASKAAIAGMCLTMARDLGSLGIRALAIAPSLFATGLTKGIPDEYAAVLTKDAAFPKRLGRPEEYAKLAVAIVENPMLNGQCLRLDAGQRFAPK